MAVRIDLTAFKRVTFGGASGEADIAVVGYDWSAATFAMQIRTERGNTASPLISLVNASAGLQGLSATYQADYAMPDTGELVPATILRPQIDAATLGALALGAAYSEPLPLYYDIHVTPVGLSKFVLMHGLFNLMPGVTL